MQNHLIAKGDPIGRIHPFDYKISQALRDFDAPVPNLISTIYPEHAPLKACALVKKKTLRKKKIDTFLPLNVYSGVGTYTFQLPIRTVSEANCFEPWRAKHARHKNQKMLVQATLAIYAPSINLPVKVHLVRYAPKTLDKFVNLPCSFKYIEDAICDLLIPGLRPGRADSDPRITMSCDQVVSKAYGIKIIFEF